MDYERRGYWINTLFSAILVVGAVVGAMMVFLTSSIYESVLSATILPTSTVILTILVVGIAVLGLTYRVSGYSREMAAETTKKTTI